MDKKKKIKNALLEISPDYSYIIMFLVIFSVFIFFAIRPSLSTAFSLKKEEADLSNIDSLYEKKIMDVSLIQTQIEESRDSIFLLDEALSQNPAVNEMVEDIKTIADKNNLLIRTASISDIDLSKKQTKLGYINFVIDGKITYPDLVNLIKDIHNQRRLKTIEKITINQDKEGTSSGILLINMQVNGYYL